MKRRAIWLWCCGGVLGLAMLVVFGGWWAIRRWPVAIGFRLPPSLAFRISTLGTAESDAAAACFLGDHPFTKAEIASRNAVICQGLRGSRASQVTALDLIGPFLSGLSYKTPERDALVFALTTSPDLELRRLARECWINQYHAAIAQLKRITPEINAADPSPLSPDRWVPGRVGGIAWRMYALFVGQYDHVTPNRYAKHLRSELALLLACEDGNGHFSSDARDQALALLVVSELFASTNDLALKPIVERAAAVVGSDQARLERLWLENTTAAYLTCMCSRSLASAGLADDQLTAALRAGFDAWWASRGSDASPQWYAAGVAIPASDAERWGMTTVGGSCCGHPAATPQDPPATSTDPTHGTPFGRHLLLIGSIVCRTPHWESYYWQRQQTLTDTQIITSDHQGAEGLWPARGEVSATWETLFSTIELTSRWPWSTVRP